MTFIPNSGWYNVAKLCQSRQPNNIQCVEGLKISSNPTALSPASFLASSETSALMMDRPNPNPRFSFLHVRLARWIEKFLEVFRSFHSGLMMSTFTGMQWNSVRGRSWRSFRRVLLPSVPSKLSLYWIYRACQTSSPAVWSTHHQRVISWQLSISLPKCPQHTAAEQLQGLSPICSLCVLVLHVHGTQVQTQSTAVQGLF